MKAKKKKKQTERSILRKNRYWFFTIWIV